jgi:1-acyl-sn-glycerol-3-phosphate acyltransferase
MLHRLLRATSRIALSWYYADVVMQGTERIPARGPLIVVSNHPNELVDALVVGTTIRRRLHLTAKATLFEHPFLAPLLRATGVVPLRRASDERAAAKEQKHERLAQRRCLPICGGRPASRTRGPRLPRRDQP